MAVKQDGTLHAATLKSIQVPDEELVDAPGAPLARFIGTSDPLKGWDTPCRILQVTDTSTGREPNDHVDAGTIHITFEPLTPTGDGHAEARDGQVRVDFHDGYFIDVVGPVPPGVPTSEHKAGASFADQHPGDPQTHLHDFPQAAQPFEPGQPALAAVAGAGQHGVPVSDERKAELAAEAQASRDEAAELSQLGTGGALPAQEPADAGDETPADGEEPEQPEEL